MEFSRRTFLAATTLAMAASRRAQAASGPLRVGLVNYPPNIHAIENTGSSQMAVKLALFRNLLSYNVKGDLVPELAESWAMEGDLTYLFRLRPQARFHSGEPVTAEDVRWTIEQIVQPGSTAYLKNDFGVVDRVEVVDPHTVRIVLKQPSVPFPHLMASYHAPVLSSKLADITAPMGAGPYRFVSAERGVGIELERFEGFYKPGIPRTAGLHFIAYGDETLRAAALEAGDVDIIEGVPWQNMAAMKANKALRLDETMGPFMYLVFNAKTGPFTDARVRQAVGFAIRRDEIVKSAMYGAGKPLGALPYPPGTPFADDTTDYFTYDPDRARKLLAEAGVAGGFSTKLLATSSPTLHQATAEVVQQHLGEIGIKAELALPEWSARVALGNRGQYEFAIMGTVGNWPDPDSLTVLLATGSAGYSRSFGFSSARIDGLLEAGRRTLDPAQRRGIYAELQKAAAEEAPIIGLAWRSQAFGMRTNVQGFHNMPGFLTFYAPITLEDAAVGA